MFELNRPRIKAIRKAKGYQSQEEFALDINVSPRSISRLEHEQDSSVGRTIINLAANKLGVAPANYFHKADMDAFISGWDPQYDEYIENEKSESLSYPDEKDAEESAFELYKRYKKLPSMYQGKDLSIEILNRDSFIENKKPWSKVDVNIVRALSGFGLEEGATVYCYDKTTINGEAVGLETVYAVNEIAHALLYEIVLGATVTATVKTVFGTLPDFHCYFRNTDEASFKECTGFIITKIEKVTSS